MTISQTLSAIADTLCGYPLFFLLIGGGLYLWAYSGFASLKYLPYAIEALRHGHGNDTVCKGEISSAQALASVVAATVGMGNIAGVAIALSMGGPGAIFWMWISALVGMSTKFHEGVLSVMYRRRSPKGAPLGGTMYIVREALSEKWRGAATLFALAGMFGTLCIMNANQLTEAVVSTLHSLQPAITDSSCLRLGIGSMIALTVGIVVLGGITRIARVASVIVPLMVGFYMIMVLYIIATHLDDVPAVISSIFANALNPEAGWGALAGIALIGARRAMLVNDAGVGTATIMHGTSSNHQPVREGLVAMLGPAIDSGLVCTLTALAILLTTDLNAVHTTRGLSIAMDAFDSAIPGGRYLLMVAVMCFGLSSMFSYSYYGRSCAAYLFGDKSSKYYNWFFIATLVIFAVISLDAAVAICDLFYALMAFPTMIVLLRLRSDVRQAIKNHFSKPELALER